MSKVVYEDKDWYVYNTRYWSDGCVYDHMLIHFCEVDGISGYETTYRSRLSDVGRACGVCNSAPSEPIQTIYLLLRKKIDG